MEHLIDIRVFVRGGVSALAGLIPRGRAADAADPADLTLEAAWNLIRQRRISPVELTRTLSHRSRLVRPLREKGKKRATSGTRLNREMRSF